MPIKEKTQKFNFMKVETKMNLTLPKKRRSPFIVFIINYDDQQKWFTIFNFLQVTTIEQNFMR